MKIEIDTNNLSDLDRVVLSTILGTAPSPAAAEQPATPAPVEKAKRQPRAAAPAPEPEVPTSEAAGDTGEDLLAPEDPATPDAPAQPTMQNAVAAATPLISGGKADQVKAVLEGLGVKRVSSLSVDQIPAFLDGISAL